MSKRPRITMLKPRLEATTTTSSGWRPDSQRGNRHERGYGTVWDKTRDRILERDQHLCQVHARITDDPVLGTEVDHIISKAEAYARGWTPEEIEDDRNLQCICTDCHRDKTAHESRIWGRAATPGGGSNFSRD